MKIEKFTETMPTIILTPLIIEPSWAEVTKKAKNLEHIIQRCDPPATASPIYQAQVQFPAYIHSSHNLKIKTQTVSLSYLEAQKVKEEGNQAKAKQNLNNSLNHLPLPLPQKKRNHMNRQTTIIMMRITEVIAEAPDHIGVNKVAEDPLEDPNKREGDNKTIIVISP